MLPVVVVMGTVRKCILEVRRNIKLNRRKLFSNRRSKVHLTKRIYGLSCF